MGGNVVMLYAGLRPERIRRLVNLEGFGMPRTKPTQAPKRLLQWLDELKTPATLRVTFLAAAAGTTLALVSAPGQADDRVLLELRLVLDTGPRQLHRGVAGGAAGVGFGQLEVLVFDLA